MKKIYKKILTINYNDKLFTIFLANDNRRTFLETNPEGKYFYPLLDDFMALNDRFNNYDPFILNVTKYTFQEKVKKVALGTLLTVSIVGSFNFFSNNYTPQVYDNKLELSNNQASTKEIIDITDVSMLDEILGYKSVSLEEVHQAIDNNQTISFRFKTKIHLFINILTRLHPTIDLRIFYENIKTLEFVIVDDNYFIDLKCKYITGQYNSKTNKILIHEDVDDESFYHELSHLLDAYYREYEDIIIRKTTPNLGIALKEAMTNVIADSIISTYSYDKYGVLLNYFRNYVDFDYETFNKYGVAPLMQGLKDRYADVDIDFILAAIDTILNVEQNEDYIYWDEANDLLDEIFKICEFELKYEKEDYYKPFAEFAKILFYTSDFKKDNFYNYPNIMYDYLDKYNELLKEMGYNGELITKEGILEKVDKYKDVKYLFFKESAKRKTVIPVSDVFWNENENGWPIHYITIIDSEGNKHNTNISPDNYCNFSMNYQNLFYFLQIMGIEYYDIIGTPEYWEKIAINLGNMKVEAMKVADLEEVPIYLEGELIGTESIDNLEITVGQSEDGYIAYEIRSKDSNFAYSSSPSASNQSNFVPLKTFIKNYNPRDFSSLELSNILNDYYLMDIMMDDCFFSTVIIKDNTLKFRPNYQIEIDDGFGKFNLALGNCFFVIKDDKVCLHPLNYAKEANGKIYLKDILTYYNVLDEDTLLYYFTKDELMEYYYMYLEDNVIEKEKGMSYK